MKKYTCKVCKTSMNIYWFGRGNKLSSYYSTALMTKVLGIATCPKCYHMEDVTDLNSKKKGE